MENLRIKRKDLEINPRFADTVIYQIWNVVKSECKDMILLNKWKNEFMWFDRFRFDVYAFKYYNWPPERIEEAKWHKLSQIIHDCIPPFQTPAHSWEQKIVDTFLGTIDQVCIDIGDE